MNKDKSQSGVMIILYNPEIERLTENLDSITKQSENVLCIDNASKNLNEVQELLKKYNNVSLLKNNKNEGIAKALNQGMEYWQSQGIEWILALDQDSVCSEDFLKKLESCIGIKEDIAIICPLIRNEGQGILEAKNVFADTDKSVREIDYTITSGTLMSVGKWNAVGKYDEKLFIDWVDVDICKRICDKGFKILENREVIMEHKIGETKEVRMFGKQHFTGNHSAFRKYFIIRNNIYLGKKKERPMKIVVKSVIKEFVLVLFFEKHKFKKLGRMLKGVFDGIRMKYEA